MSLSINPAGNNRPSEGVSNNSQGQRVQNPKDIKIFGDKNNNGVIDKGDFTNNPEYYQMFEEKGFIGKTWDSMMDKIGNIGKNSTEKSFTEKLQSTNPQEAISAINDKMSVGKDKDGNDLSMADFAKIIREVQENADPELSGSLLTDYVNDTVYEKTGIKPENYRGSRTGVEFSVGDLTYSEDFGLDKVENQKTGELIMLNGNSQIVGYSDDNDNFIKFSYSDDSNKLPQKATYNDKSIAYE